MLEPDLIALFESDAILLAGTVDADGVPEVSRAWGFRVDPEDTTRARVLIPVDAPRTHANLGSTARIAVTVTDVPTLRSAQVKGRVVGEDEVTDTDRAEHERSFAALAQIIHETEHTPIELLDRLKPGPLTARLIEIEEVYDQTPGPVAGARLAPTVETR